MKLWFIQKSSHSEVFPEFEDFPKLTENSEIIKNIGILKNGVKSAVI